MPSPALLPGILRLGLITCDYLGPIKNDVCRHEGRARRTPKSHSYHCPSHELKGAACEVKERVFSISLLAWGGLEQCKDEGLSWRDTQDLAIPYYFTPEGATSLTKQQRAVVT